MEEEELKLERKDAGEWIYRGEGAANLILSYTGSSPPFVGKVLRVQKVKRNGTNCEELSSVLSEHECLLWKEDCDLLAAPTREIAEHLYVQDIMSPLLGSDHVDAGIRVLVSRDFLESLGKSILSQRPSWRVNDADVNTQCDYALVISDHSVFPQALHDRELSISVEIKPKCGFLPCSRYILEEHAIKRSMTRFKLHQGLKLQQKKISQLSQYDPLDMFSGSKERILKSIEDLFSTPQNNFRVFLNGSLEFGSLGGGKYITNVHHDKAFEDELKSVINAHDGMRTTCFLQLVSEAVFRSKLLDRLLEVQKLDVYDIEGAIHAYYDVVSQPCVICRELGEDHLSGRYSSLHSLPLDESLKIVREYLIAATAKDLSLMISFRTRENLDPKSPYNVIFHESTGQSFDYKVSFIDLDMKPLEKMIYYHEVDQKIVRCHTKTMKPPKPPEKSASDEER
uniref:inositol-pentakisphosphate 2-kinase-like n=1 Tax=Erigeron canadensis TaxID=72917 RepID=UPI001CB97139|nr:inositol-pentakisphosphate 2-kinase-like [Erigeron canadensis]XP_043607383.1 inositol-pentakisphosphate 2-kinase-like [Erigeron canadensis]XP_043607384.1 inositol-pentakisphosphate 2-kinase-like [Erigeron canadensis]XP_043607385.1 inositol-pentakisphosphate 2-kinase-like [Erigeron canadensis]